MGRVGFRQPFRGQGRFGGCIAFEHVVVGMKIGADRSNFQVGEIQIFVGF